MEFDLPILVVNLVCLILRVFLLIIMVRMKMAVNYPRSSRLDFRNFLLLLLETVSSLSPNSSEFAFTVLFRLAESRSNPTLFETPVRRRDFFDDVNHLVATEATAKELMMSKSTEDLFAM